MPRTGEGDTGEAEAKMDGIEVREGSVKDVPRLIGRSVAIHWR